MQVFSVNYMKKMKTLFVKQYNELNDYIGVKNEVTEGCDWVLKGEGKATQKLDGTCCLVKDNEIYARFDFKPGRKLPDGAIPCQEKADEVTGHFPHWVLVGDNSQYKWHKKAFERQKPLEDGTYELIGKHFQNNPEKVEGNIDILVKHGTIELDGIERTFDGIKEYLKTHDIEGIVFHRGNGEMCKIKRVDFGFIWNGSDRKRR